MRGWEGGRESEKRRKQSETLEEGGREGDLERESKRDVRIVVGRKRQYEGAKKRRL